MCCNDKSCGCGCTCTCGCASESSRIETEEQRIPIAVAPQNIAGGTLVLSAGVTLVSPEVFDAIDRLDGRLDTDQAVQLGLDPDRWTDPPTDDDDTAPDPRFRSAVGRDTGARTTGPSREPGTGAPDEKPPRRRGGGDDPVEEKEKPPVIDLGPPCKRTCRWVITPYVLPSSAQEDEDGTLNVSTHSWREVDGPGTKHHGWVTTLGGNCFTAEWSKTVTHAGQIGFRWRHACVTAEDSGECPECTGQGRVEALQRGHVRAFTWEGFWCPVGTRRSQALAAQWAVLDIDDTRVFTESTGAQSGDQVTTTIQATIGAEVSGEQGESGKIGGKITGSISSSETRNEKSGEAKDRLNASGGRNVGLSGQAVLRTGAKASLTTAARAGGTAETYSDSTALYGVLSSSCARMAIFAWYAGVIDTDVADARRVMKGFFEHYGFTRHPFG